MISLGEGWKLRGDFNKLRKNSLDEEINLYYSLITCECTHPFPKHIFLITLMAVHNIDDAWGGKRKLIRHTIFLCIAWWQQQVSARVRGNENFVIKFLPPKKTFPSAPFILSLNHFSNTKLSHFPFQFFTLLTPCHRQHLIKPSYSLAAWTNSCARKNNCKWSE